jgi:hypothetical protein
MDSTMVPTRICHQSRRAFAAPVPAASDISIEANNNNGDGKKEAQKHERKEPPKESDSFCMNLFLGKPALGQMFPYPLDGVLNEERQSMLQMVVPPIAKFLEEVNDPFKWVAPRKRQKIVS